MTLTAEFGDEAYPPGYSSPKVKDRQPATSQPDEETTPSLQVTPPARRIRTGKHSPGFEFQAELESAVSAVKDSSVLAALDSVIKTSEVFHAQKVLDDALQDICRPMAELDRFMKSTAVYQVQKMMDDLNRPFH